MSWLVHPAGRYFATVTHTVIFHRLSPRTAFSVTVFLFLAIPFPLIFTLCLLFRCLRMWKGSYLATRTHRLLGFLPRGSIEKQARLGAGGKSMCCTTTPSCLVCLELSVTLSASSASAAWGPTLWMPGRINTKWYHVCVLLMVDIAFYWLVLIGWTLQAFCD